MSYSTLASKSSGDPISVTDWSTLRDDLTDHEARIQANTFSGCILERTSVQSIPDATGTGVSLTVETLDEGGWFPGSGSTITVPSAAIPAGYTNIVVRIEVNVEWDDNPTGRRTVNINKNAALLGPNFQMDAPSISLGQSNTRTYWFEAGDTINVQVFQDSGGALDLNSALVTIARIGYFN